MTTTGMTRRTRGYDSYDTHAADHEPGYRTVGSSTVHRALLPPTRPVPERDAVRGDVADTPHRPGTICGAQERVPSKRNGEEEMKLQMPTLTYVPEQMEIVANAKEGPFVLFDTNAALDTLSEEEVDDLANEVVLRFNAYPRLLAL